MVLMNSATGIKIVCTKETAPLYLGRGFVEVANKPAKKETKAETAKGSGDESKSNKSV